jgi:1,4-dihydroxy-2-naphthoyl-CoA hydrolase
MFNPKMTVAAINQMGEQTLAANLGIEFTEVGADFMCARMPVDKRTLQPYGLLHGGASIALAETLGSVASTALIDLTTQAAVGLEINGNHLRAVRAVREGYVSGTVRPLHIGGRTHVWEIRIEDERGRLINVSRLTMMIIQRS